MARDAIIGLVIRAKDEASAKLATIKAEGQKTFGSLLTGSLDLNAGLVNFAASLSVLEKGFRIADKAAKLVARGFTEIITKSIELRNPWDQTRRGMEQFDDTIQVTLARLGDRFMPLLTAVGTVFGGMAKEWNALSRANKESIESGIVEWAVQLAVALNSGVAMGVGLAAKAWHGWNLIIRETSYGASRAKVAIAGAVEEGLRVSAWVHDELGDEGGFADGFLKLAEMSKEWGKELEDASDKAFAELMKENRALKETEDLIDTLHQKMADALNRVLDQGLRNAKTSNDGFNRSVEETIRLNGLAAESLKRRRIEMEYLMLDFVEGDALAEKSYNAQLKGEDQLREAYRKRHAFAAEVLNDETSKLSGRGVMRLLGAWRLFFRNRDKLAEASNTKLFNPEEMRDLNKAEANLLETLQEKNHDLAESGGQAVAQLVSPILSGTKTIEQTFDEMLATIRDKIIAFLAEQVILLFLNLITGGVGGTAFGAIGSVGTSAGLGSGIAPSLAGINFAASGGVVHGGIPGRDSVPILGMPGERILSVDENRAYEAGARAGGGGGGHTEYHTHHHMHGFAPVGRVEYERHRRTVTEPLDRKMQRQRVGVRRGVR